jgi:dihydroxyacetone kinase-like predicted kinase
MAAEQAKDVSEEEVYVIPSKTVPQGLSALLAFNPDSDVTANEKAMTQAMGHVKSGQITFAVRDTHIDGLDIEKNDFMGIAEGKIIVKDKEKLKAAEGLLEEMLDDDSEILTIIYGEDVSEEEVQTLTDYVEEHYGDVEVEVHDGKQPLYSFIFSIE